MTAADREKLIEARRQIEQRTADMIERTITSAQAFAASPAYGKAICEIVARYQAIKKEIP